MDPKAAAKSKRSHTVHGRRAHQTPAAAAAHKQKRAAASSSGPRSRNLPSNWDRYDAEGDAEDPTAAAEWTGEVAPRSKGADFAFLLEQARAQPREVRGLSAPWLPSQDSPFDFMQVSTSMLEAKGEEILSWCADDNFILEDDLAPDFEVPFLSMDLHALANQLSKLKLSQRLFMEEDILPEDLADASEDNKIPIECDTSVATDSEGSAVQHNIKNIEPWKDGSHHEYTSIIRSDGQTKTGHQSRSFEQKTTTSPKITTQLVQSDGEDDKRYTRIMDTDPDTGHSKGLKFEVGAAEEELDMLLNSFNGTHLSNSELDESLRHDSTLQDMKISESNEKVTPYMSSKSPALTPVDDALVDLLSETSVSVQNEGFATPSVTSQQTLKSGHSIDFIYTKKIDVTTSIDDSVDELIEDTLSCLNEQKQTASAQGQNNTSNDSAPPQSGPSNVSDDFDSWFDSL
ncbi:protein ECERIFERUM 16 [Phragmites australis]|uniref:protein ECERIFERUM 16 n=1 Tax=Phragmites australis TaxID=29695 RepID=UPI002D787A1C|nr:protein ECERIFERUM 16 [Phragmites australis]